MQLFFNESTKKNFHLSKEESKHVIKVLRKKEGDLLDFTDGNGNHQIGEVLKVNNNEVNVLIKRIIRKKKLHNYKLNIYIAPTKNSKRFEWFLEKSTEIGIDNIIPIFCINSERKKINIKRCKNILISALKQSKRHYLPKLHDPIKFDKIFSNKINGDKYIAYCDSSINLKKIICSKANKTINCLIGPEGDFDKKEINLAANNGFTPISLGEAILRTETAGIFIASMVKSFQK